MEYALLIYFNEADAAKLSPAQAQAGHMEYMEFTKWLETAGKMKGGRPLERSRQRDHGARSRWQDLEHRWPVCRDQGASRWILSGGSEGS